MSEYDEKIARTERIVENVAAKQYEYRVAGIVGGCVVVARAVLAVANELAYWRRLNEAGEQRG